MFNQIKVGKLGVAVAVAGALQVLAPGALAADFEDFTIDPSAYTPLLGQGPFDADQMTFRYDEVISFTATDFFASILLEVQGFALDGSGTGLDPIDTGEGIEYNLYALFQATGGYQITGNDVNFLPATGGFNFWLDPGVVSPATVTTFSTPGNGALPYNVIQGGDDVLLATGVVTGGDGSLDLTCAGGINCGSFGVETSFELEPAGTSFFTAPDPFFKLAFTAGVFSAFGVVPGQTVNIGGAGDLVFVPAPSAILLLGSGLLGAGFAARRRRKAS